MASPQRILVTPRSLTSIGLHDVPELAALTDAGYELISGPAGRTPSAAELHELLGEGEVVGYLAGVEAIPEDVLRSAPSLRVISRNGVGTDAIDTAAAADAGIAVEIARGANAQGVAELAILHMLAAMRDLGDGMASVRAGGWERARGTELAGRTVGIVGLGAIGRTVAAIAAAIGADVLASDPFVQHSDLARIVDLPELFAHSDVVTLHSPPTEAPLVDTRVLASMPAGAVLVNTARSGLVDDAAVLAALESGRLSAYAVDAFESEPPPHTPLLAHSRCHPTPHIGGFTDESVHRATAFAVENLLRVLADGEKTAL